MSTMRPSVRRSDDSSPTGVMALRLARLHSRPVLAERPAGPRPGFSPVAAGAGFRTLPRRCGSTARPGWRTLVRSGVPVAGVPPAAESPRPPSPQEAVLTVRHYELMVILNPDLEERTVSPLLDNYLNVVRTAGGSVEKVDVWGRRRLSYEIEKKVEGIYAVVDLTSEPAAVQELDRQLNLNDEVLRTKVLRPELR
jgi:small subunit ribosomal protein S6